MVWLLEVDLVKPGSFNPNLENKISSQPCHKRRMEENSEKVTILLHSQTPVGKVVVCQVTKGLWLL